MKILDVNLIIQPLAQLIRHSLINADPAALNLIKRAEQNESSALCKWALEKLTLNYSEAEKSGTPACQDCGQAVLFLNVGQDVHFNGSLQDALNKGVEGGYTAARKSVAHSLTRINTASNTPAVIHYSLVEGDKLEIIFMAKGAGAENMSRVFMLTPAHGEKGVIDSVVQTVTDAGSNACPPVIIGVGIGGTMEKCAILSKLALTRTTGEKNGDPQLAGLEEKLLKAVNATGIGPQGFGGDTTALAVHVEACHTHIGMLPVAVNLQCHCARHGRLVF